MPVPALFETAEPVMVLGELPFQLVPAHVRATGLAEVARWLLPLASLPRGD